MPIHQKYRVWESKNQSKLARLENTRAWAFLKRKSRAAANVTQGTLSEAASRKRLNARSLGSPKACSAYVHRFQALLSQSNKTPAGWPANSDGS
jgi:hypothetical protein